MWATAMIIAVAAFGISRDAGAQQRGRRDYFRESRGSIDTTVAFDHRGTVTLTLNSGDIIVTGWSRDELRVHATSEGENLRFDASSSRAVLDLSGSYRGHGEAKFEVAVPTGVRVIARSQSGDISITGTRGQVEARTQSGDIKVEDAADRLDLVTLSGEVETRGLTGDVQIKTVSGDISAQDVKGDFEAESTSGGIELRHAECRYVRAHTTSGDLTYEGSIDGSGRYEFVTHSGDVRLTIPASSGAQLSVSTWSGSVESDFPMTLKPGDHNIGSGHAKRFTFEIGNAAARITAETFSGDITVSAKGQSGR
jgi:DUF4097 and DUF4098 domain-containing protein YvlB